MDFKFWNNDNSKLTQIKFLANSKLADIQKQVNNEKLNSIFKAVDKNNDGILQEAELSELNNLLNKADNSITETKNNGIIENKELVYLKKQIEESSKSEVSNPSQGKLLSGQDKNYNWSEGVDRHVGRIYLSSLSKSQRGGQVETMPVITQEMKEIGKEVGFEVESLSGMEQDPWLEDYSIRRSDGKVLVISDEAAEGVFCADETQRNNIINARKDISSECQGDAVYHYDLMNEKIQDKDKVYSKSYLEGGNVLNTCKADGTPAAVIGSESVDYTLLAMGLDKTDENVKAAKKQIVEDLGLKEENVTFLPQYDFHVDMCYRPLKNGQMAVPDYDEGVKILKRTQIQGMSDDEKQKLITDLEEMQRKTAGIRQEAEENLKSSGYQIIKIPCFALAAKEGRTQINFMNGVGGTSKTGQTFYITNKSDYPELNKIAEQYYQKAGIDKVYFVSTQAFLREEGGIDCLTQEI